MDKPEDFFPQSSVHGILQFRINCADTLQIYQKLRAGFQ